MTKKEVMEKIKWFKLIIEKSYDAAMSTSGTVEDLFIKQAKRTEEELTNFMIKHNIKPATKKVKKTKNGSK